MKKITILIAGVALLVTLAVAVLFIKKPDTSSDDTLVLAEKAVQELSDAIENGDMERAQALIGDAWGQLETPVQFSRIDAEMRTSLLDALDDLHHVASTSVSDEDGLRYHEFSSTATYREKTLPILIRVYYHISDQGDFIVDEIDM